MYSFTVRSIGGAAKSAGCSGGWSIARGVACTGGAFLNQEGSRYSSRPSRPPSRPKPLSRYPPKPQEASKRFVQLTQTTPALSCAATWSETLMLSLHTQAARPYTVLLASSTASRGVRNVIAASTGPKISCCATTEVGCTLLNNVGGKNNPRDGMASDGGCQHVAPSATPWSTSR